jgi:molybdenum cofactor cytidylyltransferase
VRAGSTRSEPDLIAGAILAAGEGRRFGGPKQIAELDGRPLLEYAVEAMITALARRRVVVVLGAHAEQVEAEVDFGPAETVRCEGWEEGIAASLRCAVEALPEADPLVIALGDQPGITPAAIDAVVTALEDEPAAPAARATYDGHPGHPVALRPVLRAPILRLRGDAGAGRLLTDAGALEVDCSDLARGTDVDTADQLSSL